MVTKSEMVEINLEVADIILDIAKENKSFTDILKNLIRIRKLKQKLLEP